MKSAMKALRPFLSVLCVSLMMTNLTLVPRVWGDIPDRYVWQVERVEESSAFAVNGFEGGDVAFVWEDIPGQFFPLKITEVWVWWYPPPGYTPHHLAVRVLFYDGPTGQLRYVLEHAAVIRGLNRIRLAIECTECEVIFNADDGPAVGIGIQYVTEFEYPVWSGSGHIVVDDEGCWSGTNLVYDSASAQWVDPCAFGMTGNFAIRVVFEPLCPERIGDIDGDMDIDLADFAAFQGAFTGPGADMFGDPRVYSDLNNDYAVDLDDFEIMAGNIAGPGSLVECPEFDRAGAPARSADPQARPFSREAFPDIPPGLERVPAQPERDSSRWTYVQIGVVLAIGVVLTLMIGPCVQSSCRAIRRTDFATGGSFVNSPEQDRIRAAIDYLGNMYDDEDSQSAYFWLVQVGAYNPMVTGAVRINRSVGEDNTEFGATHVLGRITIHRTFITGDHWDDWGVEGLAFLLFAEWQHNDRPGYTERQCQEWLMQWRERNNLEGIAPEFGHGFGD